MRVSTASRWSFLCWLLMHSALLLAASPNPEFLLSFEVIPSIGAPPGLRRDASYVQREQLAQSALNAVLPDLIRELGIEPAQVRHSIEPGGFELRTGASVQSRLAGDRELAEQLAAALGWVFGQRSVLISDLGSSTAGSLWLRVRFPNALLTPALAQRFFLHAAGIDSGLGGGYRGEGKSLVFVNLRDADGLPFSGLDDDRYSALLERAALSFRGARGEIAERGKAQIWLIGNDWRLHPDGNRYLERLPGGASVWRERLQRLRARHHAQLEILARSGVVRP